MRPHLDYEDIIYDQASNSSFDLKLESIQYNSALAITVDLRGTPKEDIYQELGLDSLQQRRWYRKLYCFYTIYNYLFSALFFILIPLSKRTYQTRNAQYVLQYKAKHIFFKNYFSPSTVLEWSKLDLNICNAETLAFF